MCKRWQVISNISWVYLKSVSDDPKTWGIKKMSPIDYIINFRILLKRCGRFLKHLILDTYDVNRDIVNLISKECPNLKDIDLLNYKYFDFENFIAVIKPIFNKVKKFSCCFGYGIKDKDLKSLFSTNKKLEYLEILWSPSDFDTTFFYVLPQETMRELIIVTKDIPFRRVCRVSLIFQRLTSFTITIN